MNRSTTAQEALVAELIGDLAKLIKRAETFATTMDKAQEQMTDAAWLLDTRIEPFRHALAAEIEQVKASPSRRSSGRRTRWPHSSR